MNDVKIIVKTGTIGPRHDPYGCETVTVVRGTKEAEWYSDGLGTEWMRLFEGGDCMRDIKWAHWDRKPEQNKMSLCKILFRRWVGISCEDAIVEHDRMHDRDPYGPPSKYI